MITVEQLESYITKRFEILEERIDSLEQLHSNMMLAYMQLSAAVETIMQKILEDQTTEESNTFAKQLSDRREKMLSMIKTAVKDMEESASDGGGTDSSRTHQEGVLPDSS